MRLLPPKKLKVLLVSLLSVGLLLLLVDSTLRTTTKQSPEKSITAQERLQENVTLPTLDPVGVEIANVQRIWLISYERTTHEAIRRRTLLRNQRERTLLPREVSSIPSDDIWYRLFGCETGGTYNAAINTGNGYYGAFQFSLGTWQSVGGTGYPHQFSYEVQKQFAIKLQSRSGWGQWPACSRKLGLR